MSLSYRQRRSLGLVKRRPRKLSPEAAKTIRQQYFGRIKKQRELALEFDTTQSIISKVVSGQIW